jgi:hypothetical protein
MNSFINRIKLFLVRPDAEFAYYSQCYQAKTLSQKTLYLSMFFIPGVIVFLTINVKPVFDFFISLFGISGHTFQFIIFLLMTFGIHILVPVGLLRFKEKLSLKETLTFLSMDKIDWQGLLVALLMLFALVIFTHPYLHLVARPFGRWIRLQPMMTIPSHSIFVSYESMFDYSAFQIALMLIGNHVGEELYYRGYLMKKTAFLGKYNWVVNGVFFSLYHIWQIPQTWPLFGLSTAFGLLMQ